MGMQKTRIDMSGYVIGRLTVKHIQEPINKKNIHWVCICECGNRISVSGRQLRNGKTKSCGCLRKDIMSKTKWKGCGEVSGWYLSELRCRAKSKNLNFDLDVEFLWQLLEKQNHKCSLSGLPLTLTRNSKSLDRGTGSIDRINSSKGYTKDNVQWVHKDINFMKQEYNQEYFLYLCKLITEYGSLNHG